MSENVVVSFEGVVKSVEQERIPEILLATIESVDGKYIVQMDWHKELFVLPQGSKVHFKITRNLPTYRDGVDFVGRATVVTIRKDGDRWRHLLSIGGLLVLIESSERLDIDPTEKVYVVVAPLETKQY